MKFGLQKHAGTVISREKLVPLQNLVLDGNREIRQAVQWEKIQITRD
jgi:hypothetical protein